MTTGRQGISTLHFPDKKQICSPRLQGHSSANFSRTVLEVGILGKEAKVIKSCAPVKESREESLTLAFSSSEVIPFLPGGPFQQRHPSEVSCCPHIP